MLRGSLGTIREHVKEDVRNPNYRDIDKRYRKALTWLKTTEMSNSDMEYHKACPLWFLRIPLFHAG